MEEVCCWKDTFETDCRNKIKIRNYSFNNCRLFNQAQLNLNYKAILRKEVKAQSPYGAFSAVPHPKDHLFQFT